jgi:uncharacterized protein with PIN domain
MKFIVDHNVGKLVKWLRMLGYDTEFFTGEDDWQMVISALRGDRIILTRDTGIMKLGVVDSAKVKAILINSDDPEEQIRQLNESLDLDFQNRLFTRCMECNALLEKRTGDEVKDRVPPYVYKTQKEYMECPSCQRIYWKGTHWQAMIEKLRKLAGSYQD